MAGHSVTLTCTFMLCFIFHKSIAGVLLFLTVHLLITYIYPYSTSLDHIFIPSQSNHASILFIFQSIMFLINHNMNEMLTAY